MEIILLGIYSFFVWLIFIKFKWLPWNIYSQVTPDVRVFRYTVPIISQVRGRVVEVPIEEGNVLVKKGDVLFRLDPTPYQLQVNTLQAQLANAVAQQKELEESLKGAKAKVTESTSGIAQATAKTAEVNAKLELARGRRVARRNALARE